MELESIPNLSNMMLQVLLSLSFVIAVILSLAWISKRYKLAGKNTNNSIRALAVLPLGKREKLIMIEAFGQKLLIGATAEKISVLHTFFDGGAVSEQTTVENEEVKHRSNASPDFSRHLSSMLKLNDYNS